MGNMVSGLDQELGCVVAVRDWLGFVSQLLLWLKPHLAPLFAWSAVTSSGLVGRLLYTVILMLRHILMDERVFPRRQPTSLRNSSEQTRNALMTWLSWAAGRFLRANGFCWPSGEISGEIRFLISSRQMGAVRNGLRHRQSCLLHLQLLRLLDGWMKEGHAIQCRFTLLLVGTIWPMFCFLASGQRPSGR